jgi:hypothetical protein
MRWLILLLSLGLGFLVMFGSKKLIERLLPYLPGGGRKTQIALD